MERLVLVVPNITHQEEAIKFIQEFKEYNSEINGVGGLKNYLDKYDHWLIKLENDKDNKNIESDKVPASTYFAIRIDDNKIVGMINIRHKLNNKLIKKGGHIGYGVRPTERRKGYATEILTLGLKQCKELKIARVLVTCDKDNIGSVKTIQKNKGILDNELLDEEMNKVIQRYWINNE
jgi:predicted acetyltransferase